MNVVHLTTKNDTNGNPRRLYVLTDGPVVRDVWDDGYDGVNAVSPQWRPAARRAPTFEVTPAQYNRLKTFSL